MKRGAFRRFACNRQKQIAQSYRIKHFPEGA